MEMWDIVPQLSQLVVYIDKMVNCMYYIAQVHYLCILEEFWAQFPKGVI